MKKVQNYLKYTQSSMSDFFAIYMVTPENKTFFSNGYVPPADYYAPGRGWYKAAAASDDVIITSPYTDVQSKKMVITIAIANKDSKGNITSVLGADLFIDDLLKTVNKLSLMNNGYPVLTSPDGNIITHKNKKYLPTVDSLKKNQMFYKIYGNQTMIYLK